MPGMTGLLATAIRLTTFLISVAQRSGAQISDGGESTPDMVAAFLQGTDRSRCGFGSASESDSDGRQEEASKATRPTVDSSVRSPRC